MRVLFAIALLLLALTSLHAQKIERDTFQLKEINIQISKPVYLRNDTLVFVADSFNTAPNLVAEDILKRLPGVEVSASGKITVMGKEINTVYINGEIFTITNIATLTRLLPADMIDKIEIADLVDAASTLSNVKGKSHVKVINFKLKSEFDGTLLGKANAGSGTSKAYQLNNFVNYMGTSNTISSIGYLTNLNDVGLNPESNSGTPIAQGIVRQKSIVVNHTFKSPDNKFRIATSYQLNNRENDYTENRFKTTSLPGDVNFYQNSSTKNGNGQTANRFASQMDYQLTKTGLLTINILANSANGFNRRTTLDTSFYSKTPNQVFRSGFFVSESKNPYYELSSAFQKKFNKAGRTLMVKYTGRIVKTEVKTESENTYSSQLLSTKNVANMGEQLVDNTSHSAFLQYSEPIDKKNTLLISYTGDVFLNKDIRQIRVADSMGEFNFDPLQSYSNRYSMISSSGLAKYQYAAKHLTLIAGAQAQNIQRKLNMESESLNPISDNTFAILPTVDLKVRLSDVSSVQANYSESVNPPAIDQLQTKLDFRDSFNVFIGNPNLKPEKIHSSNIDFTRISGNFKNSMTISLTYTRIQNKIVNSSFIEGVTRKTQPVNENGSYFLSLNINNSNRLPNNFTLFEGFKGALNNNIARTNFVKTANNNYTSTANLRLQKNSKIIDCNVEYFYRFNQVASSSASTVNVIQTHNFSVSSVVKVVKNISVYLDFNYSNNTGYQEIDKANFILLNVSVIKNFEKVPGLAVKVQAYDIFNRYPNVSRTVGDNYIEDVSVNRFGRYFLFSVLYSYSSLSHFKH